MDIDKLKATISKKGGVAKQNRFNVFFTPPKGSLINKDPSTLIGTIASGGGLKNLINDPRDISLLCESAVLPGRQINTVEYQDTDRIKKQVNGVIDEDVTLSFILTNDYYIKNMFDNWTGLVFDSDNYRAGYKNDFVTDVIIQQINHKNIPIYGVKLENAFPTTLTAVTLDNNAENTIQKFSVTLSYDKYVEQNAFESLIDTGRDIISAGQNAFSEIKSVFS